MDMKAIFFIFLILVCHQAPGQIVGVWRAGSAYALQGKVFSMNVFVSEGADSWSPEAKDEILGKLAEAEGWIKKQADAYHVALTFSSSTLGYDKDIKMEHVARGTASGKEPVDWVSLVLRKAGYTSNLDFYYSTRDARRFDNMQVFIFVKGKGNGYSMPYSSLMNKEKYFVEGSVLYEQYWDGYSLVSSGIAHEMLHLYGAWDLYKTFAQTEAAEKKVRKMWPNSIMLRTSFDINELMVDELTAWLVGWNPTPQAWYDSLRPDKTEPK